MDEIASFMESFESLVSISSKEKISLSLDDIYYMEYCRVKAENFLCEVAGSLTTDKNSEVKVKLNKAEIGLYKDNLKLVVEQIKVLEKIIGVQSLNNKNKIDSRVTDSEFSVRKPGNRVYAEAFLTEKRNLVTPYDLTSALLIGASVILGVHESDWSSVSNVALTFTSIGAVCLGVLAISAKLIDNAYSKVNFKRNYTEKKEFISKVLSKIIIATSRKEYIYLTDSIRKIKINTDSMFNVYYAMAKVEILGEYVNKIPSTDTGNTFETNKEIEEQLRDVHNLLKGME